MSEQAPLYSFRRERPRGGTAWIVPGYIGDREAEILLDLIGPDESLQELLKRLLGWEGIFDAVGDKEEILKELNLSDDQYFKFLKQVHEVITGKPRREVARILEQEIVLDSGNMPPADPNITVVPYHDLEAGNF